MSRCCVGFRGLCVCVSVGDSRKHKEARRVVPGKGSDVKC